MIPRINFRTFAISTARTFGAFSLRLAAVAVFGAASLSAATYYVDYAGGSNANTGTTASSPWKQAPGDPAATGGPANRTLLAGDTVLFKGGVTYVGKLLLNWSGASGNPITYDGAAWNGTRAIITTNNEPGSTAISDTGAPRSNLVLRGFDLRDIGGYAENDAVWSTTTAVTRPPGGTGIALSGGGSDIIVQNSSFSEIGQWQNKAPMSGTGSVTGTGVSLEDNRNVTIKSCDFTRMKTGVSLKAVSLLSDITIQDSSFHNYMNWLIDIAPRSAGAVLRNITVDGCFLYDYKEFDEPNWQGFGEKPHQDGIFLRTSGMVSTWENIVIRNTRFHSDQTSNGGTASIYISQGPSVDIYNCVFLNDNHSNASINVGFNKITGMKQSVRVWNNTFVGGTRALKVTPGNSNPDYIDIRNNVFIRTNGYDVIGINTADIGTLVMDNNLYYGGNPERAVHDGSRYLSLGAWQTQSGKDSKSVWADADFVSVQGAASTWNVSPATTSSPLIGAGVNLSSFFTTTIDSAVRSSSWDIGAFSYSASGVQPLAVPSNLRVQIQ